MTSMIIRIWAIFFSKYKGLELYVFNDKKDLSYLFMRIERTWATFLWELKGLDLYVFNDKKDLSYLFMRI